MIVDFGVPSSKAGTTYRIEWWGYHRIAHYRPVNPFEYYWGKALRDDIVTLSAGKNELSHRFYFDPSRNRMDDLFTYDSYGVSIYEYNPNTRKNIKWVASSDFRPGQAADYVSVDSEYYSDLSIYYCTIDWDPYPSPRPLSGYHCPFWVRRTLWTDPWPYGRPYYVWGWTGNMGSPRFAYQSSCSREFPLPQPWLGN